MLWGGVSLAAIYGGLCLLAFVGQRKVVFPAPVVLRQPSGRGLIVEGPKGTRLLWREAAGGGPVVVHFHGNAEQVADSSWLAEAYAERGVSFAAVEYPGYPGVGGAPGEAAMIAAGEQALLHLTQALGVARERLVLSGQSVGTGVAVAMAARGWGTKLVLLSPYTSLPDVGARMLPWLPVRWLLRDRFESAMWAPSVTIPVLIVHGTEDDVIPIDLGRALSRRFPSARLVELPRAHHNDLWTQPEGAHEVFDFVLGPAH